MKYLSLEISISEYVFVSFQIKRKAKAELELKEHLEEIQRERNFNNRVRELSREPQNKIFYFEIDSMDQTKTALPHFINPPKNLNPDLLIDFHLTVVK